MRKTFILKAYADEARRAIARIEEEERLLARRAEAKIRYEEVCKSNSQEEVEKFATDYHDTEYAEKVQPEQSGFLGRVRLMGVYHCEFANLEADMSNLQKCFSLPRCLQESAPIAVLSARF